jgi:hypothetical protein
MIPNRKISETILEFGEPILEELPENASKEEMEAAMRLIVSAWNAVVLDDWNKTREFEKAFLKALMPIPKEFESIPRKLIKRKKRKYSSDPRAVGNYWVIEKNGELVFRAEAHLDLQRVEGIGVMQ